MRVAMCLGLSILLSVQGAFSIPSDQLVQLSSSVVRVSYRVYVDGNKSNQQALWKIWEKFEGAPLLNQWLEVRGGSGTIIDNRGHLLTNAHVVAKATRESAHIEALQQYLSRSVPDNILTPDQKFLLRIDIRSVLQGAKESAFAEFGGSPIPCQPLQSSYSQDLALLRAEMPTPTRPIPFGSDDAAELGAEVTAIGYPLSNVFSRLFDHSSATVTRGSISALRKDTVWGIQHTADLNPGNSGGPLLNNKGELIGVNVGNISDSSGLFFAIPLSVVQTFLEGGAWRSLWEMRTTGSLSMEGSGMGEVSVGSQILLLSDPDTAVWSEGVRLGEVPYELSVTKSTTILELKSKRGSATLTLHRSENITEKTTLQVPLRLHRFPLTVTTDPIGAMVLIDGVLRGRSPISVDLSQGEHRVSAVTDDYEFAQQRVAILTNSTALRLQGEPLVRVRFVPPLAAGTKVTATSLNGDSRVFVDPQDLGLPAGRWWIGLENPGILKPSTIELAIAGTVPVSVATTSLWETAELNLVNSWEGSVLEIDGTKFGVIETSSVIRLKAGEHHLVIQHPAAYPFDRNIRLVSTRPTTINVLQERSEESRAGESLWMGGGLLGVGSAVGLAGMSIVLLDPSLTNPNLQPQPQSVVAGYTAIAGFTAVVIGAILLLN